MRCVSRSRRMFYISIKTFLEAFEKKVSAQNMRICENIPTHFELQCLKISTFSLFLTDII
eukprot:UN25098